MKKSEISLTTIHQGRTIMGFLNLIAKIPPEKIDAEISKMIEAQYQRAIQVLTENKDKLTTLAERLLDKEVIFKEDLEKIFGKRPFDKDFDKLGQEKIESKEEKK